MITRQALRAASLTACIAVLSPACAEAPAAPRDKSSPVPSKLDYLVLASFADAPNMLAMTAYPASTQELTGSGTRP